MGVSASRCLWVQLVGSRSWGAGGLASPGCPETRAVQRHMKDVQAVSAPLGSVGLSLLASGSSGAGVRACGGSGGIRGVRADS